MFPRETIAAVRVCAPIKGIVPGDRREVQYPIIFHIESKEGREIAEEPTEIALCRDRIAVRSQRQGGKAGPVGKVEDFSACHVAAT